MFVAGIPSEFNPFHAGHAFLFRAVRERLGQDTAILCVMSGNFTQRGEPALLRKHARAEAAVRGGADLVIELPLPWALSSAEVFARGMVSLILYSGAATHLCFGSECGSLSLLQDAADALSLSKTDEILKQELSEGFSYGEARTRALKRIDESLSDLLLRPNNLLAVEYLKALRELGGGLMPLTVQRCGARHDETSPCPTPSTVTGAAGQSAADADSGMEKYSPDIMTNNNCPSKKRSFFQKSFSVPFSSEKGTKQTKQAKLTKLTKLTEKDKTEEAEASEASEETNVSRQRSNDCGCDSAAPDSGESYLSGMELRRRAVSGEDISRWLDKGAAEVFAREFSLGNSPPDPERYDAALLSRLRQLSLSDYESAAGHDKGLARRLESAVQSGGSLAEILSKAKTRRYPMSALRRTLLRAGLGIAAEDADGYPPYLRILAFSARGQSLLREMNRRAQLPRLIKPADIRKGSDAGFDAKAQHLFFLESAASDFYTLLSPSPDSRKAGADFTASPRKIDT